MKLNILGGIIMLVSLFLPVILITEGPKAAMLWMFGLMYWMGVYMTVILFVPDIIGFCITVAILVLSILCIVKDTGETKVFGIIAIVFVCAYYAWYFIIFVVVMIALGVSGLLVFPFFGFFGILIGAILNIIAK